MISDIVCYGFFLFDVTLGEIRYLFFIHNISPLNALLYETHIAVAVSMLHIHFQFG